MNTKENSIGNDRIQFTNIVSETKRLIMDEPDEQKNPCSDEVTDQEVKKAVELLNPDPNSLKSRG